MDRQEFALFASALRTYYPRENILPNNQAMELWFRQLQDIPYNVAESALNAWVATNKWSPSVADIREITVDVCHGEAPDWSEAWDKVLMAVRKYGMYQIVEAMDSFDNITRQCVERLGFRNICMSENVAVDRANFRTIYENCVRQERKEAQIPFFLKEEIKAIQNELNNAKLLENHSDSGERAVI